MSQSSRKKTYSELITNSTFEERLNYLKLRGSVGSDTFGFDRYLNQQFYKSSEWKSVRNFVIARDGACDLGIPGREITGRVYIHHINPLAVEDITESSDSLLDPENLICVSHETHNAIHYGDINLISKREPVVRSPNDACPWRK